MDKRRIAQELVTLAKELTASRNLTAARAAAQGRLIKIESEIKISGELYVSRFTDAAKRAGQDCTEVKSDILDILDAAGIDSRWEVPVVNPGRVKSWVTLSAKADEDIPKEVAREIASLRG